MKHTSLSRRIAAARRGYNIYAIVSQSLIPHPSATKVLCNHAKLLLFKTLDPRSGDTKPNTQPFACRSPELWDRPQEFDPLRFPLDRPVPNEVTHDFAYLPFGGGKRKCIGAPLLQVKLASEWHLGPGTGIVFSISWPCSTADRFVLTCLAARNRYGFVIQGGLATGGNER